MGSLGQSWTKSRSVFMAGVRILITALVACLLFMTLLYIFQHHYVYYPERTLVANPGTIGLSYEDVYFETPDGVKLYAWFIPSKNARGVILFCHGNAGNISHRLESIQIFHRLSLEVFIFDYRGYGQSEGKPTERGTYEDAEAAWRYLTEERQVKPAQIIVFGRSLGGAVASWLAQRHTPGALILESTFTSVRDIAAALYPYLPVGPLLRFEYDTARYITAVQCPVLIIHSRDDETIPFSHGWRLFEVAKEPKRFMEITGGHNEGFITSGNRYHEGLNGFISDFIKNQKLKDE